jgi:hypothetical protein
MGRMNRWWMLWALVTAIVAGGCAQSPTAQDAVREEDQKNLTILPPTPAAVRGALEFANPHYGSNGRACVTCHLPGTFTIAPWQVQLFYYVDPLNPPRAGDVPR